MIGNNIITQIFKRFRHKGLDMRSVNEKWEDLKILLPEDCIFIRKVWQRKWGYSLLFETLATDYILQFTHVFQGNFVNDKKYKKGTVLGPAVTTDYMDGKDRWNKKPRSRKHLHFEVWTIKNGKKHKAFDPVKYLKLVGQKCGKAS